VLGKRTFRYRERCSLQWHRPGYGETPGTPVLDTAHRKGYTFAFWV